MLYMFRKKLPTFLFFLAFHFANAQEISVDYTLGQNNFDRHKYSKVLSISEAENDQTVLIRNYYGGMPLRPKGYFIELYDADLNLIKDYNNRYESQNILDCFVKNGQLYVLELLYNDDEFTYQYVIHHSPLEEFNFTKKTILSVPSKKVANPLVVNKYNQNFDNGFSTAVYFNKKKSIFAITVQYRERKAEKYHMHVFDADLKKQITYDFTAQTKDKNYAFENIEVSQDFKTVYFMGKAFFKKKRFQAKERKFQYELVRVTNTSHQIQEFNDAGRYSESLKPILLDNSLIVLGFYSNRKDNRYNGLVHFKLNPNTLAVQSKKYNSFSEQFMIDKFGRKIDAKIKNLIFKDVYITPAKDVIFSAEEYFVTQGKDISGGNTKKINRYHYNDIVCAKFNVLGEMIWARNINKTELTKGDAAYASYTAYGHGDDMYFFINSGENPKKLSKERIMFKQGYSRNPNMFVIKIAADGNFSHKKLIDDKEIRLPIMVSKPLIKKASNELMFYAKRGTKKRLVRVHVK